MRLNDKELEELGFVKNKRLKSYCLTKFMGGYDGFFMYNGLSHVIELCGWNDGSEPITILYDVSLEDMKSLEEVFKKYK